MNDFNDFTPLASRIQRYFLLFMVFWTLVVVTLLLHDIYDHRQQTREMVRREALIHLNKDLASRVWAASHGGVYVPISKKTHPNPFLGHIPDRDIRTPSGKELTLMNPAYMIRQMMEKYADRYGVRGHITSLQYFSEATAPDGWERVALVEFESGVKEVSEFTDFKGSPHFRFMRPLVAEKQCLKCHSHQGYTVGDIRGGLSVSVPMTSYLGNLNKEVRTHAVSYLLLWVLGLGGIGVAVRGLRTHVHEREKAESLLARSQANYSTLVESSLTGIYIIQEGLIRFANSRAAEIYGFSKDELIGMDSLAMVHPEDRLLVKEIQQKRITGAEAPSEYETRGIRKDGRTIWVQRRIARCEYDGKPAILGNVLDITALKKAQDESEDRARELQRSNRDLNQFAAVASHDLSEPLRKIRAFGDILMESYTPVLDQKGNDYLERMRKAAGRMQDLIAALLSYSRVTTNALPFTRVDLTDALKKALSNLEISIQKTGGKIQAGQLPVLEGEPTQMIQLFQNLIGNSLKFHRNNELPVIRIRARKVRASKDRGHNGSATMWEIRLEDNGIGFNHHDIEKIFGPFERLHGRNAYRGQGMGLAICRKIVERHGGSIIATGTPDRGAVFIVTLPAEQTQQGSKKIF